MVVSSRGSWIQVARLPSFEPFFLPPCSGKPVHPHEAARSRLSLRPEPAGLCSWGASYHQSLGSNNHPPQIVLCSSSADSFRMEATLLVHRTSPPPARLPALLWLLLGAGSSLLSCGGEAPRL